MLWATIRKVQNETRGHWWEKLHYQPATNSKCDKLILPIEVDLHLGGVFGLARETLGTRYYSVRAPIDSLKAKRRANIAIYWRPSLLILSFIAWLVLWITGIFQILLTSATCPISRSIPGIATIFASAVLMYVAVISTLLRRRVCTLRIYPIEGSWPLPIVRNIGQREFVFSIRILHPGQREILKRCASGAIDTISIFDKPSVHHQKMPLPGSLDTSRIDKGESLWPIVKFAIDRLLYKPNVSTVEESIPITTDEDKNFGVERRKSMQSLLFSYKLLGGQVASWLIIVAIVILVPVTPWASITQSLKTPLAAGILIWGISAVLVHRSNLKSLEKWEREWRTRPPFGSSPIFYFNKELPDQKRPWEELVDADFSVPITQFGVDSATLFNLLLGGAVAIFLAILEIYG